MIHKNNSLSITTIVALVSLFGLLAIGCSKKDGDIETQATDKIENGAEGVAADAESAFATLKDNYVAGAEKLVTDWGDKVSNLEERKNSLPEIAQKPLEESFKAVSESLGTMDGKFDDLKGASEDDFDKKKEAFTSSVSDLNSVYENLLGKF